MSYYAELGSLDSDGNREVLNVISVDDEWDEGEKTEADGVAMLVESFGGTADNWKKTSCNTRAGVHEDPDTGQLNLKPPLRKNCAGIGMLYDAGRDAFYNAKPYPSWTLVEATCKWESPDGPRDGAADKRFWNETTKKLVNYEDFQQAIDDNKTTYPQDINNSIG